MKTILITGGSGFIGTHLARKLRSLGYGVRVLDLVAPKTPIDGVDYRLGDVRVADDVRFSLFDVDAVYHFAAIVSVPYCQQHAELSYQTNLLGTLRVVQAVQESGRRIPIFFASSSAVYGDSLEIRAHHEEKIAQVPASFYAAQKLGSEQILQISGVPSISFRFFNVFGPGQDPSSPYSGVISVFAKKLSEGRPLQLNGAGLPTRDFISVHDVVLGCAEVLKMPQEKWNGAPINLGTARSLSIRELAQKMMEASRKVVQLIDAPWRDGDVHHSLAAIDRARDLLGFQPQIKLENALEELLR